MIIGLFVVAVIVLFVLALPLVFPTLLIDSVGYALRWRPDDFKGWTFYGELFMRKEMLEHALYALKTSIKIYPNYPRAWQSLGDVLFRMGDLEGAKTAYGFAEDSL